MLQLYHAEQYREYFHFLLDQVGGEDWCGGMESNLARLLSRKFYWTNKIDEGVAVSSLELRTKAMEETDIPPYLIPSDEPSVLEVLIFIALRVDELLMFNPDYEPRVNQFFAEIMSVLGFDSCDEEQIDERIDMFLDGKVRLYDGEFGADPYNPTLWEQVNAYYKPLFELENPDI